MRTRREAGFALPLTIFIVTLVTIMLSALFVRVGVERRIAEASGAAVDALAIAHSGLQRYYVHYDTVGTMPADGDSIRVNVTGGYADVVAHIAHDPPGFDRLYIVRSTGRVIEPTQGADPQAVRTVAQFAVWQSGSGTIDTRAAFLAANYLNDPDGIDDDPDATPEGVLAVSALDDCGMTAPAPHSLRVPAGNHVPRLPPSGYPPPGFLALGPPDGLASVLFTDIDWAGVIGGDFLPTYTTFTNWNTWSSYLITAPVLNLPDVTGSGLLVVTGDLNLTGSTFNWRGVILVGGTVYFNTTSSTQISGMIVSGLNYQLGATPPVGHWQTAGTLSVTFNSCRVDSAMASLGGLAPVPNAWVDNWATF